MRALDRSERWRTKLLLSHGFSLSPFENFPIWGQQALHCGNRYVPSIGASWDHVQSCPLLTDGKEPKPSICSTVLQEGMGTRTDLAGTTVTVGVSPVASLSLSYLAPEKVPASWTYSVVDSTESKSSSQVSSCESMKISGILIAHLSQGNTA